MIDRISQKIVAFAVLNTRYGPGSPIGGGRVFTIIHHFYFVLQPVYYLFSGVFGAGSSAHKYLVSVIFQMTVVVLPGHDHVVRTTHML
nr:MAG: hypothetical protein J07AB56_07110 [Candidatus Nanosalinarum sp. J07AB56]